MLQNGCPPYHPCMEQLAFYEGKFCNQDEYAQNCTVKTINYLSDSISCSVSRSCPLPHFELSLSRPPNTLSLDSAGDFQPQTAWPYPPTSQDLECSQTLYTLGTADQGTLHNYVPILLAKTDPLTLVCFCLYNPFPLQTLATAVRREFIWPSTSISVKTPYWRV